MATLLRSQIECPSCGELVASVHRHDFRYCPCGAIAIDGGRDYLRIVGSEWRPELNWSISVDENLNLVAASHLLAVLSALARQPHPVNLYRLHEAVRHHVWTSRRKRGRLRDVELDLNETSSLLLILIQNDLAQAAADDPTQFVATVVLADHPEVP